MRALAEAQGLLIRSYTDLFYHPAPPIELLVLTKDYAKACLNHPNSLIPEEVATVLYCASIVVALLRWNRRITRLPDQNLRSDLTWLCGQSWIDDGMKSLLEEELVGLSKPGAS